MGRIGFYLRSSPAVLLLATATPALAQSNETAAEDSPLGEIVVTAQRRQESLQDVPLAVTAFSADDLVSKQISTTSDLPRLVPNAVGATNVGIGSANSYFIRGLGNTESIATFDPPVGTYVDDIYVSRQNANNFAFFDIDRIEVLRGPQGILFGRNTTGGALNVILKKPADTLGGYIEGSYGRFNSFTGRASIDIPITDKLLSKFSAFGTSSDGFVYNQTTGERNNGTEGYGLRAALRALPTEDITWDVAIDYIFDNTLNVPSTLVNGRLVSNNGLSATVQGVMGLVSGDKSNFVLQNEVENISLTSNLQIETGGVTINFITGYRDLGQDYLTDVFDGRFATGGFALPNQGKFKQFSQEVKFNGSLLDGKIDYVAGLFYIHETNRTDLADVFTLDFGTFGVPLVLDDRLLRNTTSAPAAYAQFDFHASDKLTLTVGARYTEERKRVQVDPNANPGVVLPPYDTDDVIAAGIPIRQKVSLLTPRFAAEYKVNDDTLLFASATRGFKSGGWNARALSAENFLVFGPEKVWSYETGLRSELLDRKLRLNVTGFYTDVTGFQIPQGFVDSTGAINFVTRNGSDFRNYGLEAEAVLAPVTGLSLFANIGLQYAKYTNPNSVITAQQTACLAGDAPSCGQGIVAPDGSLARPQRTPKFTTAFGGSYALPLGVYLLTPAVNASFQSRNTVGTAAVPGDFVDGEWLVGGNISFRPADGPWSLSVECANCFDNNFVGSNFPPGFTFFNVPATWRVKAGYRF